MKTILITGASSGIGRATSERFLSEGWNVVATMRNTEAANDLADHPNALIASLDVTDQDSIESVVAACEAKFGQIDVLLNNAGYGAYGPLETFSMDRIERIFATNVMGVFATMKAVIPGMRKRRSGTIVNVSSVGGRIAFPTGALYHGTKFAVEGLSEALLYELAAVGIRMRIVQPGFVNTNFGGAGFDRGADESLTEYGETIAGTGRMFGTLATSRAEPEEVAQVIWEAVHDPSDRLRFSAGQDEAIGLLNKRQAADDAVIAELKGRMQG